MISHNLIFIYAIKLIFFFNFNFLSLLMMEQPDSLLDKHDTQLLGRLENGTVVLAAARGSNVLGSGAGGAEDVVGEGELLHWKLC